MKNLDIILLILHHVLMSFDHSDVIDSQKWVAKFWKTDNRIDKYDSILQECKAALKQLFCRLQACSGLHISSLVLQHSIGLLML